MRLRTWLSRFSVQTAVRLALSAIGLVVVLLCAQALISSRASTERLRMVYEERVVPADTLTELAEPVRDISFRVTGVLAGQLPPAGSNNKLKEDHALVHTLWERYHAETKSSAGDEGVLVDKVDRGMKTFDDFCKHLSEAYLANDSTRLATLFSDDLPVIQTEFLSPVLKLETLHSQEVKASYDRSVRASARGDALTATFATASVVILALAYLVITFQIRELREKAEMLESTSQDLRTVSDDLVSGSAQLSSAANEQASAIEETSSSMHEIAQTVGRNVTLAEDAVTTAKSAETQAESGRSAIREMVQSMNAINDGNERIKSSIGEGNRKIGEILQLIGEITQKTQVINEIVFQTKLLSFNASVEAARAGEHGRGFSVVAEEVGNLASLSGRAAREIKETLDTSSQRVRSIIEDLTRVIDSQARDSSNLVENGLSIAGSCERSMADVIQGVRQTFERVQQISLASGEQAQGIGQVNSALQSLNELTQTNTQIAHESNRNGQNLLEQSSMLAHLVTGMQSVLTGAKKVNTAKVLPFRPVEESQAAAQRRAA